MFLPSEWLAIICYGSGATRHERSFQGDATGKSKFNSSDCFGIEIFYTKQSFAAARRA